LKRWVENGKSKGFLLPIGPLTFFENWYASCQPNAYWLARYDNRELTREDKLREAQIILDQADEFLRLSSRRLFFSKKIMKHGAPKIISYLGSAALLIVCTFFYLDFRKKQNTYIIEKIKKWGVEMLASNKVNTAEKAAFLINYERISPGSFAQTLEWMDNDTLAFDVADNMFSLVQNLDSRDSSKEIINPLIYPLLSFMDERLNNLTDRQRLNINKKHSVGLSRINHLLSLCAYVKSYDNSRAIGKLIDKNACIEQMKKYVSDSSSFSGSLDPDFMLLAEINLQFEKADTLQAMQIFSKLNLRRLAASRAMKDFQRSAPYNSYNKLAKELANHLALNGYLKESFLVLNLLSESSEKRNTLLDIAASLQKSGPVENTFIYLDSLFKNNDLDGKPKFGLKLIRVLAMVGSQPTIELASEILEEVPGLLKQRGIRSLIIGIASNGFYYNATKAFPEYITSNKKMELYNTVLEAEISSTALRSGRITKTLVSSGWESYDMQNSRDYGIDYEILKGNDLKFDSLD